MADVLVVEYDGPMLVTPARLTQEIEPPMPTQRTCSIDGCNGAHYARGWCLRHYARWRDRGGDPSVNLRAIDPAARFWSSVEKTPVCWLWKARRDSRGYGVFVRDRKARKAHVVAWEMERGSVPQGMELDHLCRIRECVRAEHLEAVSHRENVQRGKNGALRHLRAAEPKRGVDGKFIK